MSKNTVNFVEILISLNYLKLNDKFIIKFSFNKRTKNIKYLFDKRYNIYDNFEKKILDKSLKLPELEFDRRIDNKDNVNLIYNIIEETDLYLTTGFKGLFVVSGWIPPNAGCEYCKYKNDIHDTYFHCEIKNKILTQEIKNCKVFMQKKY